MAIPGWPPWLAHLWYRTTWIAQMPAAMLLFSFRFAGSRNVPQTGPVLLVANHQSFLDPTIVGLVARRDIHYLARKTLFTKSLTGWFIRSVNAVPVDHTGVAKEGLTATIGLLQQGQAVIVFPEGERTHDGTMQPLKPGVHLVLKRAPAAVVPIGIAGAYESFPRTRKTPYLSPFFLPAMRGTIAAVAGKPLRPERLLEMSREECSRTLFDAIQAEQWRAEKLRRKG